MRDHLFTAASVEEAVQAASRALGLPASGLRYVVLEQGAPGGRGLSPTPARIAVLLDQEAPRAPSPPPEARPVGAAGTVVGVLAALERALGESLAADVREEEEGLLVQLEGPGRQWLLGGEGAVLVALDHLLRRIHRAGGHEGRLRVLCEGWRERRDAALRERVLELARAVREDGLPRRTGPLNAYERRVVHLTVAGLEGLQTYSEGQGQERAVTIAPAAPPPQD